LLLLEGKVDMNGNLTPQDIQEARSQLQMLDQEVRTLEGTLAGGKKQGPATIAIESLLQTQIWFGNPVNNLTHLTSERFEKMSIPLIDV
jgi:hypothetical protein